MGTATDIGVIYNWNELMKSEQKPNINFESVNMATFFWCGIAFLVLYRVICLIISIYDWCVGDGKLYHVLLVLVDLYIFVSVYDSFQAAQGIITSNAEKRAKRRKEKEEKRKEAQKEAQKEVVTYEIDDNRYCWGPQKDIYCRDIGSKISILSGQAPQINKAIDEEEDGLSLVKEQSTQINECDEENNSSSDSEISLVTEQSKQTIEKIDDIEPVGRQMLLQLMESITESMPQIVLQSVFIIRSANDDILKENGSNLPLILLSVVASLFSISNKFVWGDRNGLWKKQNH